MKGFDIILYRSLPLNGLADELNKGAYQQVLELCTGAINTAMQLRIREMTDMAPTEVYTTFCLNFTGQLKKYKEQKRNTLVPYIYSLSDKEKSHHNCAHCSHNCSIDHAFQISFLKESHEFARVQLYRLTNLVLPADTSETENLYYSLRSIMFEIEQHLVQLRFIEEMVLIPKILDAQRAINIKTIRNY